MVMGPTGENVQPPECLASGFGNELFKVVPNTLHIIPWSEPPDAKVGEVYLECKWADGSTHEVCPRTVAKKQFETLKKEFDYDFMSAFEFEFMIINKQSQKPVFDHPDILTTLTLSEHEEFLIQMDRHLAKAGVMVEDYQTEMGEGQFEAATVPQLGIEALDKAFLFKEASKEICSKAGLQAVFMTCPFPTEHGLANGAHFNHSLWTESKKNVLFYRDGKDKMSDTYKHWIAGLIKHTSALMALFYPTANCYRRLHKPFIHHNADWAIDHRLVAYRAKNYSPGQSYLENRLPSSAANPYLVAAGTIAAGLDGLRNKLELPPPCDEHAEKLPATLAEALDALDKNQVLRESLGHMFVDWFLLAKRTVEVEAFKAHDTAGNSEEEFAKERKMYMKFI